MLAISRYKSEAGMSIETLESWLLRATVLVVVGVVMEGMEHVAEFRKSGWKPVVPKLGYLLLVIGLGGELLLQPLIEKANTKIRAEADEKIAGLNKETQVLGLENSKLILRVEHERDKRVEVEKTLQAFKTLTQFSEEALAGSRASYNRLIELASEKSELGERARERVKYIQKELAYYEQPPGIVLAGQISKTINGQQVRLVEFPTPLLFNTLEDESITNITRFSLINDICQKPLAEVNKYALEMLKTAQYLPAVAATTSILRRLNNKALPFLDIDGWIAYLSR
jgi:hypothetical protein